MFMSPGVYTIYAQIFDCQWICLCSPGTFQFPPSSQVYYNPLVRKNCPSPSLVWLVSYWFIPKWTHGQLFYPVGCEPMLLTVLLLRLLQLWPLGALRSAPCPFLWALPTLRHYRGLRIVSWLPCPHLRISHFCKERGSFYLFYFIIIISSWQKWDF